MEISRDQWEALVKRVEALEDKGDVLARTKAKRGTRLPADWRPSAASIRKMCDELHTSAFYLMNEDRRFCDYFWSAPGQKGVKTDWDRAWCNWMRGASERGQLHRSLKAADKSQGWMELDVEGK